MQNAAFRHVAAPSFQYGVSTFTGGAWSRQEGDAWLLSSNVHKQDFFLSDLPSLSRMLLIVKVQLILLIN